MSDREKSYYYRAVPGSRELMTASGEGDLVLNRIEDGHGDEGAAPQRNYKGEWLGGASLEQGVMVPVSVFDSLAPEQTPLEQAVYMHLFRISYGNGKNWCRAGKRELMNRARISDRRLNAALDGLVRKGHLKPLNRNTKGTLYRVYLPSEVLDTSLEPGVVLGERLTEQVSAPEKGERETGERKKGERMPPSAQTAQTAQTAPTTQKEKKPSSTVKPTRTRPLESPLNEERFADVSGRRPKGPGVAQMAEWFFREKSIKGKPKDRQMAVTVLTELLEDGFSRQEVQAALGWFVKNQPAEKDLTRLPYFITRAIEESAVSEE